MARLFKSDYSTTLSIEDLSSIPHFVHLIDENKVEQDNGINSELVRLKLGRLKNDKGQEPDSISPMVLKEVVYWICEYLAKTFCKSLNNGKEQTDLEVANATNIFKRSKRSCFSNYRSISFTSDVKSLVKYTFESYFTKFRILLDSRHDFSQRNSCLTNF